MDLRTINDLAGRLHDALEKFKSPTAPALVIAVDIPPS